MTLASYSELETTVASYLARTDRGPQIQNWVRLVELEVERKLGLRSQQLRATGTLAGGSELLETPVGILYPQMLSFDGSPPINVEVVPLAMGTETAYADAGDARPFQASVWGVNSSYATQIRVFPVPPADVNYTLYYTTGITPLTAAAPVNYLLFTAADLYLYGCLFHGHLFDENPEAASGWRGGFDTQIESVKKVEWKARAKAGRLQVRSRGMTP